MEDKIHPEFNAAVTGKEVEGITHFDGVVHLATGIGNLLPKSHISSAPKVSGLAYT